MAKSCRKTGFSLTEVLLAVGTLTIGMVFIAGVFPVAIHLTTIATERTIAAVASDEAFAKITLYGVDVNDLEPNEFRDFRDVLPPLVNIEPNEPNEFEYPSIITDTAKQYYWSALCRLTEERTAINPNPPVQVVVFVSRKPNRNLKYPDPDGSGEVDWPMPVSVGVSRVSQDNELEIGDDQKTFINDGSRIVDDDTGRIYRVLERYPYLDDDRILLDRDWEGGASGDVWVVPPPVNSGRYPCIAIYQKVIRF